MTDDRMQLSRRKLLAGATAVGAAGVGAGFGTSALFSDEESFANNSFVAGELDLVVDYETDVDQDGVETGSTTGSGELQGNPVEEEYVIEDVKPGDSGSLKFCPKVVDNPSWIFVGSNGVMDYENNRSELEQEDDFTAGGPNEGEGAGELSEAIEVTVSYCEEDGDTIRELDNPDWYTLRDLLSELTSGFLLDGDVEGADGRQAYPGSSTSDDQEGPCICVDWEIPTDVGNEIQSDSVAFDIQFAAVQERHNSDSANPFVDAVVSEDGNADFTSIQDAVNDVGENGTVFIENGTYREQVVIGYDGLTLEGESRDGVEIILPDDPDNIHGGNGPEVISVYPAAPPEAGGDPGLTDESWWRSSRNHYLVTGVTLRNLTVDGDAQSSNRGLYFTHAQAYNVDNVVSKDNGDKGSGNGWSRHGRFKNVDVDNNGDDGITVFRGDGYTFRNVTATNNADDGIDIHGNDHTLVGVRAEDNGNAGIEFTQGENNEVTDSTSTGNELGVLIEKIGSSSATPEPGETEIEIHQSNLHDNTIAGLQIYAANHDDLIVNANDNWWGEDADPTGDQAVVESGTGATLILDTWLSSQS